MNVIYIFLFPQGQPPNTSFRVAIETKIEFKCQLEKVYTVWYNYKVFFFHLCATLVVFQAYEQCIFHGRGKSKANCAVKNFCGLSDDLQLKIFLSIWWIWCLIGFVRKLYLLHREKKLLLMLVLLLKESEDEKIKIIIESARKKRKQLLKRYYNNNAYRYLFVSLFPIIIFFHLWN